MSTCAEKTDEPVTIRRFRLDDGSLTDDERKALEEALERTEDLMTNLPSSSKELAEIVGCAVDCWLTAYEDQDVTQWQTDRGMPSCEIMHDDDCVQGLPSGGTANYPLSCDDPLDIIRDGWQDGVHYQYNACMDTVEGSSDVNAVCRQQVSMSLECEQYGPPVS